MTLGDLEAFLTKLDLQLRVYFDRRGSKWVAELFGKGRLDLVPSQPKTFIYADTMNGAIEGAIKKWQQTYGGAS